MKNDTKYAVFDMRRENATFGHYEVASELRSEKEMKMFVLSRICGSNANIFKTTTQDPTVIYLSMTAAVLFFIAMSLVVVIVVLKLRKKRVVVKKVITVRKTYDEPESHTGMEDSDSISIDMVPPTNVVPKTKEGRKPSRTVCKRKPKEGKKTQKPLGGDPTSMISRAPPSAISKSKVSYKRPKPPEKSKR